MAYEIEVRVNGGSMIIGRDGVTGVRGQVPPESLVTAKSVVTDNPYSVAYGYPGAYLAQKIARAVGGEAILPDFPDPPEGAEE